MIVGNVYLQLRLAYIKGSSVKFLVKTSYPESHLRLRRSQYRHREQTHSYQGGKEGWDELGDWD